MTFISDAFKSIDIKLVGPFDILNGQCVEDGLMVTHWRHYYDPPEFQVSDEYVTLRYPFPNFMYLTLYKWLYL